MGQCLWVDDGAKVKVDHDWSGGDKLKRATRSVFIRSSAHTHRIIIGSLRKRDLRDRSLISRTRTVWVVSVFCRLVLVNPGHSYRQKSMNFTNVHLNMTLSGVVEHLA